MEHESAVYTSPTVEEVFEDFKGRRAAMIKALTTEFEDFYQQCSPEMENLCLYGHPDERWEVNLPSEVIPSELPEPALGINFARDGLQKADWLSLVAIHSDVWLLSMAFYFGAKFGFDKSQRNSLFGMINDLPTIFEVVVPPPKKQTEGEKPSTSNHSSSKPKSSATSCLMKLKQLCIGVFGSRKPKSSESNAQEEEEDGLEREEDEEHKETLCGDCEEEIASDEFGICCDVCQKRFHGKCVKITNESTDFIKQYKCPSCSNKRARSE